MMKKGYDCVVIPGQLTTLKSTKQDPNSMICGNAAGLGQMPMFTKSATTAHKTICSEYLYLNFLFKVTYSRKYEKW